MASLTAASVARTVIKKVSSGEIPDIKKIHLEHGYTKASANAYKALTTKSYRKVMNNWADKLEKEKNRIIEAMEAKDLSKEEYRHLAKALDVVNKQHNLATGSPTENVKHDFSDYSDQELADMLNEDNTSTS